MFFDLWIFQLSFRTLLTLGFELKAPCFATRNFLFQEVRMIFSICKGFFGMFPTHVYCQSAWNKFCTDLFYPSPHEIRTVSLLMFKTLSTIVSGALQSFAIKLRTFSGVGNENDFSIRLLSSNNSLSSKNVYFYRKLILLKQSSPYTCYIN